MVLIRNLPQPTDILSDSQVDLQNNNNAIDTSFGLDHYAASNLTPNNGKHAMVTTPSGAHPLTPTDARFYAATDNASIGSLQYTRTPVNQVPTPLSCLQSSSAGITVGASGGTTTILDFSGLPYCYGSVISTFYSNLLGQWGMITYYFFWNGSSGILAPSSSGFTRATMQFSGTSLIIQNSAAATLTQLAWTLNFQRIFTPL